LKIKPINILAAPKIYNITSPYDSLSEKKVAKKAKTLE